MKKVFNFSDFSALYESADVYDQNLKIIVSELLDLYCEMADYGEYPDSKIYSDFDSILAGNSIKNKIEAFKKIMGEAKTKSLTGNKIAGAKELFDMMDLSYSEFLKALNYIADKYEVAAGDTDVVKKEKAEDSKLLAEVINKVVSDLDAYLKENEPKVSESDFNFSEDSQIFEGKKSRLSDAEDGINLLRGKIDSYKMDEDPRKKKFAIDADLKIVSIANSIKALKAKKNRDIEKSEIEKVITDLSDLETNFETGINKIIDENTTDQELEKLRNKARDVNYKIKPLRKAYLDNKSAADSKAKDETGKGEKIKVKLDTDYIDYAPEENNTPNPEVKKFQELVVDAFKNTKSVTDLPFYQKMGTTGRFGPNTRDMIKFLKKSFKLKDFLSGDITKELVDEIQIQRDTIKESISSKVYSFSSFVNISEAAFDLAAGLEFAKTLPTYKAKSSGAGSSGATKKEIKEAEGSAFNKKSAEEKWSWLTKKYITGYKTEGNNPIKLGEEYTSNGKKYWKIVWETWKVSGFGVITICSYPEGSNLGTYIDVIYPDGKNQFKLEDGKWGNKINPEDESNWLPTNKYTYTSSSAVPSEERENIKKAVKGVIDSLSGTSEDEEAFINSVRRNIKTQKDLDDADKLLKRLRIGPTALRKKTWTGSTIEQIFADKDRSLDNKFYMSLYDLASDFLSSEDRKNLDLDLEANGFVPKKPFKS